MKSKDSETGRVSAGLNLWGCYTKKEGSWYDFVVSERFEEKKNFKYFYEVKLKRGANILKISTVKELSSFTKKYGFPQKKSSRDPTHPQADTWFIDWNKVQQDYAGIEICPYLGGSRSKIYGSEILLVSSMGRCIRCRLGRTSRNFGRQAADFEVNLPKFGRVTTQEIQI